MGTDEGRRAGRHAHPKRHQSVEINPTIAKQSLDLLVRVLGREALGLGQTLSDRVDGQRARRSEGRPRRPTRATRRAWREDPRRRARRQTCGRPRAGTSVLWLPASSGRGRPARELWGWKPAATSVSMRAPAFRGEQPSRACVAKNRSCPAYAGGAGRCLPRSDRKWRLRLAAEARSDEGLPQGCACSDYPQYENSGDHGKEGDELQSRLKRAAGFPLQGARRGRIRDAFASGCGRVELRAADTSTSNSTPRRRPGVHSQGRGLDVACRKYCRARPSDRPKRESELDRAKATTTLTLTEMSGQLKN
jgi:hypothetical protein